MHALYVYTYEYYVCVSAAYKNIIMYTIKCLIVILMPRSAEWMDLTEADKKSLGLTFEDDGEFWQVYKADSLSLNGYCRQSSWSLKRIGWIPDINAVTTSRYKR